MTEMQNNIAMLIDADNAQLSKIEAIVLEVSKFGRIVVKRAYANWTKENLKNWDVELRNQAIKPVHQVDYIKGKNATDMALIIDAMDFLYNSDYYGYAIVSSDSDFTPLATKLREAGKFVIGIGRKDTSSAFVKTCDTFVYLEDLQDNTKDVVSISDVVTLEETKAKGNNKKGKSKETDAFLELDELLKIAAEIESYQDVDGFVNISSAGSYIKRVKPDFDIKKYGFSKLPKYLESKPKIYEVLRTKGKGTTMVCLYKLKQK